MHLVREVVDPSLQLRVVGLQLRVVGLQLPVVSLQLRVVGLLRATALASEPSAVGCTFSDLTALKAAVGNWSTNATRARSAYGDIGSWDVSAVESLRYGSWDFFFYIIF